MTAPYTAGVLRRLQPRSSTEAAAASSTEAGVQVAVEPGTLHVGAAGEGDGVALPEFKGPGLEGGGDEKQGGGEEGFHGGNTSGYATNQGGSDDKLRAGRFANMFEPSFIGLKVGFRKVEGIQAFRSASPGLT
jgi:hypothetical protein